MSYRPAQSILTLGDGFWDAVEPARFPKHVLRYRNPRWAARVGLETLDDAQWIAHFGRFEALPSTLPQPLALRYHGHQFRVYNPDIGDGRGFLFAQLRDDADRLLDLGTKGSGTTPWSRFGDGRLTLKGGVREVLATAMLEALGVNTSKSFSLIETGEALTRNDEPSPTRSAVLVRLSHSHIRFGTFQRLAYHEDHERMARLVDYCLAQLLGKAVVASLEDNVALLMQEAVARAAALAASYMAAGFVHGVLNTDNINITGESFDYGPYRFAPSYDPAFVAAYFDQHGLYAFGRQAEALHWNVYQLARALLLIVDQATVIPALETYPAQFEAAFVAAMLRRLGIKPVDESKDTALAEAVVALLSSHSLRLEQFYFDVYGGAASQQRRMHSPQADAYHEPAVQAVLNQLDLRAPRNPAQISQPYFARESPCTLLIDEIESIWAHIAEQDDWSAFYAKLDEINCMRNALATLDES